MSLEQQLWNDFGFRQLLNDLFKARKDAELGPMRLGIILQYVQSKGSTGLVAPNKGIPAPASKPKEPAIELTDEERTQLRAQVEAEKRDPMASANEAADIVANSIKEGKWQADGSMTVLLRSDRPTGQLKELLKERGIHVSGLQVGLDPGGLGTLRDSANSFWTIRVEK